MKKAGVNIVTLPVFGWGTIQKEEDVWNFEWLDEVIALLHENGIKLCLATATAAVPAWIDQKYPDILRVDQDGRKVHHGSRHTFCPHSPNFSRLSTGLARKMAERYGTHPALLLWHVSNEYGSYCYCEKCSAAFRKWLENRYGSLDALNFRYNMNFWGQSYTDWSQIEAPIENAQRNFQGLLIDYNRFQSESIMNCCKAESAVLREITPEVPITTNMMGSFKPLDYFQWAKDLDIVSWDCYPPRGAKKEEMGFSHSLMRGLKDGAPWMLMEQTPSQQNWQNYNSLKRPGILRLWSYQAIAHGANAVMYFQWRRSPGAQEMFHGAVVEHAGRTDARVFKEVAALGHELKKLDQDLLSTRVKADVAILFDWENWWSVEFSSGPSIDLKYVQACRAAYTAFTSQNFGVDVVSPEADFSGYKVVVAPVLKMIKPGEAEKLKAYVSNGGTFLATYFSGITDETDRSFPNGYPGPLADLLGIWVEETDALSPTESNLMRHSGHEYPCGLLCDRITLEGAEMLASYGRDFYSGEPCFTLNRFGSGNAYYLGTAPKEDGWREVARLIGESSGLHPIEGIAPGDDLEVVQRVSEKASYTFLMNHRIDAISIALPEGENLDLFENERIGNSILLNGYQVAILRRDLA